MAGKVFAELPVCFVTLVIVWGKAACWSRGGGVWEDSACVWGRVGGWGGWMRAYVWAHVLGLLFILVACRRSLQ